MKTFEPVSTQLVAVAFGARRERGRVGAAAGLGERVAAEPLAAREPRQVLAAAARRVPHFATVFPKRPFETETIPRTDESALPSSSQSRQYETESSPPPPSSSGSAAARKPASASVADERARQLLGLVPRPRVRDELARAELARGRRGSAPARG